MLFISWNLYKLLKLTVLFRVVEINLFVLFLLQQGEGNARVHLCSFRAISINLEFCATTKKQPGPTFFSLLLWVQMTWRKSVEDSQLLRKTIWANAKPVIIFIKRRQKCKIKRYYMENTLVYLSFKPTS